MERLVIKSKAGSLYYNDDEHGVKLEPHEIGAHQRRLLLERLHAYEDTDLTPEQIRELAERDTAKAPVDIDDEFDMYVCPSCNMAIGAIGDKRNHHFCLNCGQWLKFKEDIQ